LNGSLRISEAASIALHTMTLLALNTGKFLSVKEISKTLSVSEAHLSKVLQRLARRGLAHSIRGPKGGFRLGKPADEVTLLDVFEAIDGPFKPTDCLMKERICKNGNCLFGDLLGSINRSVLEYLGGKKLIEVESIF